MKASERVLLAWVVVLTLFAGGYLGTQFLPPQVLPPNKDWLDVFVAAWSALGAVATLAAAGVALWLGLTTLRRDHETALVKARFAAATAEVVITAALHRFSDLDTSIEFRDLSDPHPNATMSQVFSAFSEPIVQVETETLTLLVPLPGHCAVRAARAFALLLQIQNHAARVRERWLVDALPTTEQEHHLKRWTSILHESVRLLSVVQQTCQTAAVEGAPSPTGEELWGEG